MNLRFCRNLRADRHIFEQIDNHIKVILLWLQLFAKIKSEFYGKICLKYYIITKCFRVKNPENSLRKMISKTGRVLTFYGKNSRWKRIGNAKSAEADRAKRRWKNAGKDAPKIRGEDNGKIGENFGNGGNRNIFDAEKSDRISAKNKYMTHKILKILDKYKII